MCGSGAYVHTDVFNSDDDNPVINGKWRGMFFILRGNTLCL